ncbi:hypothetical protein HPA15_00315 [Streptococcus suis]|nr:hypothetical protein [Streptococcus suis]
MIDEASKKKLAKTYRIFCLLCLMWIPYFWFLHYWITHDWTIPLQVFAMCFIVTAVFQPLFWYIMLGMFLWVFTGIYSDEYSILLGNVPTFLNKDKENDSPKKSKSSIPVLLFYWTLFK